MRRRSLLAALAGGLAGCGGSDGGGRDTFGVPSTTTVAGTDGPQETPGPTTDLPPGIDPRRDRPQVREARRAVTTHLGNERRLVLAGGSLSSDQEGGRLTVGFVRPPTPDRPARLRMVFENAADHGRRFAFGPSPPFSQYWATPTEGPAGSRSYLLVPDDDRRFPYHDVVPERPTRGRWVATRSLGAPTGAVGRNWIGLEPGESIAGTYTLLVHPEAERSDRGVHRFAGAPWFDGELLLSDYRTLLSDPGESRLPLGPEVPNFPGAADTRWYHEVAARPDPPETFLRPELERMPVDGGEISLGLENYEPYTVTVGGWELYKLGEDRWWRIAPWGEPGREEAPGSPRGGSIPPGGRREVGFVPATPVWPDAEAGVPGIRVGGLGRGRYALGFGPARVGGPEATSPFVLGERSETTPGPLRTTLAALLELTGPTATVTPTNDVVVVERSGSTVTVRVDPKFVEDPAEGSELVVRRSPDPQRRSLLAEQVNQFAGLRNALVHFEDDVMTVGVVTSTRRVRRPLAALGRSDRTLEFAFDGGDFLATARDVVGETTTTSGTADDER